MWIRKWHYNRFTPCVLLTATLNWNATITKRISEQRAREKKMRVKESFDVRNTFIVFDYCQHMQFSCYGHGIETWLFSIWIMLSMDCFVQCMCMCICLKQRWGDLSCLSLTSFCLVFLLNISTIHAFWITHKTKRPPTHNYTHFLYTSKQSHDHKHVMVVLL